MKYGYPQVDYSSQRGYFLCLLPFLVYDQGFSSWELSGEDSADFSLTYATMN